DAGFDVAVFHHHRVIEHRHVSHAAVAMPGIEIAAKDRVLLGRAHSDPHVTLDVGIAAHDPAHALGRAKIFGDDPHRNAGAAALAGRPVSDRLAATEAAL